MAGRKDDDFELDAQRYKRTDAEGVEFYIMVAGIDDEPREVFLSNVDESNQKLQGKLANITMATRFISKCLCRDVPVKEVIEQLNKSSRKKNDIPDLLSQSITAFTKRFDDLSNGYMQKWKRTNGEDTCMLEVGVEAGEGWTKIQTPGKE